MKKIIAIFLALSLLLSVSLFGCQKKTKYIGEVNVYNWGEYIDESIFADFEAATSIKVNYSTFTSNEMMYSNLKTGGASYDVIIPSDYMISRLIEEDMLEKLDFANIPNYGLIDEAYKNREYDPANEYSVPYMWGIIGIIYNTAMIDEEITSWGALFDAKYTGEVLMFDNSRDAFGIALKYLGYSLNTTDEAELNEAYELLLSQKPIKQAYVMDQIFDKLEGGEAAMGPYYVGDYLIMREENPDLAFAVPEEGTNWFVDAMCVPKNAANKKNAELFINYMCGTEVSIANMDYIGYASANTDAVEEYGADMEPDEYAVAFADAETLDRCEVFTNLPQDTLALYDTLWSKLKS